MSRTTVGAPSASVEATDLGITGIDDGDVLARSGSAIAGLTLAAVAESGDYTDLDNKPTIPADGSDVGLADSPGSDGDYVLRRASGSNSWAAASGGSGLPLPQAASGLTAQGLTDSAADLTGCSFDITADSVGDLIDVTADIYIVANPDSRTFTFRFTIDGQSAGGFFATSAGADTVMALKGRYAITAVGAGSGAACGLIERCKDVTGTGTWNAGGFRPGDIGSLDTTGPMAVALQAYLDTASAGASIQVLRFAVNTYPPGA